MTQAQFLQQLWDMAQTLNLGDAYEAADRPEWLRSKDVGTAGHLFKAIAAIGGEAFSDALHSTHEFDAALPLMNNRTNNN